MIKNNPHIRSLSHSSQPLWISPTSDIKPPTHAEVHLWRAKLAQNSTYLATLSQCLSPDEKARAARFIFEKDRQAFTLSRGILRHLLSHYLAVKPALLHFIYNPYGKPNIPAEINKKSLTFNLSHAGDFVVYAFTKKVNIGIDIEQIRENIKPLKIVERFFSHHEQKLLRSLPPSQHIPKFFHCWVGKEAFIKAIGEGLSHPLDTFDIDFNNEKIRLLKLHGSTSQAQKWTMQTINIANNYSGAFAIALPNGSLNQIKHYDLACDIL